MALEEGKIYLPKNAAEVRDDFLTDVRLELLRNGVTDPPVQPKSDAYILGTALANMAQLQYSNIAISSESSNVFTAGLEDLKVIRDAIGLPEVSPSPSSGSVEVDMASGATSSMPDGTEFVLPNGKRGKVVGTYLSVSDGTPVDVVTQDTGADTVLAAGQKVRFVNPPLNINVEATVLAPGLSGGADEEDAPRMRTRILNRLQNVPAGGNWSHIREIGLNALAALQDVFVYPALGGPGSYKVVPVVPFDRDNNLYTRAPNAGQISTLETALFGELPSPMEIVVQAPRERSTEATLQLTLPDSNSTGGWLNATADLWPQLEPADNGRVEVTVVTSPTQITTGANTATAPSDNVTYVLWWAPGDMRFYKRLVTVSSGSAGAWALTLDAPLTDSLGNNVAVGDFICPAAENADDYATTFLDTFEGLGPEENTTDPNRLPRALRHPYSTDEQPGAIGTKGLVNFFAKHPEVSDGEIAFTSSVVLVGSTVDLGPGILVPDKFGFYPQ